MTVVALSGVPRAARGFAGLAALHGARRSGRRASRGRALNGAMLACATCAAPERPAGVGRRALPAPRRRDGGPGEPRRLGGREPRSLVAGVAFEGPSGPTNAAAAPCLRAERGRAGHAAPPPEAARLAAFVLRGEAAR